MRKIFDFIDFLHSYPVTLEKNRNEIFFKQKKPSHEMWLGNLKG
ncbi:unknown protein [Simkania negevensis Z]|uniref:Uncharacterized protein n=1 Tax=Simkania negevensis (strain ATCC VR-1471 / DSM 27360 / Z) TaxID=331113 RepID=F8L611_SIMNZ|nr:unknown protein [Simkania negevensis Z]